MSFVALTLRPQVESLKKKTSRFGCLHEWNTLILTEKN
jgi:hypothetical protein